MSKNVIDSSLISIINVNDNHPTLVTNYILICLTVIDLLVSKRFYVTRLPREGNGNHLDSNSLLKLDFLNKHDKPVYKQSIKCLCTFETWLISINENDMFFLFNLIHMFDKYVMILLFLQTRK